MRIDVLTLFPGMILPVIKESIIGRAISEGNVTINVIDFRDFSTNKHQKVDDYPFGGGVGMVLQVEPIVRALRSIEGYQEALKIITTPQGETLHQSLSESFSHQDHLIILCGHYEGFDERVRDYFDCEVSIGDYVLTGGEYAALVIIDSVIRLRPGVLNKDESHQDDSFSEGLLEYPQYTRPRVFEGKEVPEVLLSGNHQAIKAWRDHERLKRTKERRKDLYDRYIKRHK